MLLLHEGLVHNVLLVCDMLVLTDSHLLLHYRVLSLVRICMEVDFLLLVLGLLLFVYLRCC